MSGVPDSLDKVASEALCDEPKVGAAYLYGSVARSEDTSLSDVDLALVPTGEIRPGERGPLLRRITLKVGRLAPGRRIDVRFLDELPTAIRGRAVADGTLVFEQDPVARVRAEVAARLDYHDFLLFEREGTREGLKGLRRRLDVG
jgi:predicted nucleotidyltransferase